MIVRAVNPDGTNIGSGAGGSVSVSNFPATQVTTPFLAQSLSTNSAPVSAPTAGTTICTIASGSLGNGLYLVNIWGNLSGNAAADEGNMAFTANGQTTRLTIPTNAGNGWCYVGQVYFTTGATAMTVTAVNNATGGTEYMATITATRIA
jgi:hypothetical protein